MMLLILKSFPQTLFLILGLAFYSQARLEGTRLFIEMSQEDHTVENLQFLSLLLLTFLTSRARFFLKKPVFLPWLCMLVSAFFFFVAMEEISWGQRIFNWSWETLQNHNNQSETNLHNLLPLYGNIMPYYMAASVLILIPWILKPLEERNGLTQPTLLKWDSLAAGGGLLACYLFINPAGNLYFYEFSELLIYFILICQVPRAAWSRRQK